MRRRHLTPVRTTTLRAAAVLAASALTLAACGTSDDPGAGPADGDRTVRIVLDWSPNTNHTGLYLADARGYFAERGLTVEIVEPGDVSGLQLLAAGEADLAYSVAESLVPARAQGAPVVSVAAVIQHNTSSLISLADQGIRTPADLAGHAYGTYGSDLEAALVAALAACGGVDRDDVEFVPLTGTDFRVGLTTDMFDTAWVYDGWDTIRLRDVDGLAVDTVPFADYPECIPDWYTPLVATREDLLDTDPELVSDVLAALAHGYRDAMADPAAGADALMAAAPELDRHLVELSAAYLATRYADSPEQWGHQDAAVWDGFVDFLMDAHLVDADFDTDAAWTDGPLTAAVGPVAPGDPSAEPTGAGG